MSIKMSDEDIETLNHLMLDDSTKIIGYLDEQSRHQKKYNSVVLTITILGALSSLIAAITGVIVLFLN